MDQSISPPAPLLFAGLRIDRPDREGSLSAVVEQLEERPLRIAWINAHCANVAQQDPLYREAIGHMEWVLNDGIGIEIASRVLGSPVQENLHGTDWIPALFDRLSRDHQWRVFLLGGTEEHLLKGKQVMEERWPHVEVVGMHHGFFQEKEEAEVVKEVKKERAELLLCVMGVPKQELFLDRHWEALTEAGVRLGIAGGAALEFMTEQQKRAPEWMQRCRLEWVYRFWQEPGRMWRRYLIGNVKFLWLVGKEWMRG